MAAAEGVPEGALTGAAFGSGTPLVNLSKWGQKIITPIAPEAAVNAPEEAAATSSGTRGAESLVSYDELEPKLLRS